MIKGLNEIISFNPEFSNSINLYLNLNNTKKVLSYIPTKSSVDVLDEYLQQIETKNGHTSMLIGPYGKGKSHLLLVLMAILSLDRSLLDNKKVFEQVYGKVKKVDSIIAERIKNIWESEGRYLPVIINSQEDATQAFLLGISNALKRDGLEDLTPETYYSHAVNMILTWKKDYPDTYSLYTQILKQKKIGINEMLTELKQYNSAFLGIFREIYPELTSGSVFNPLVDAELIRLYRGIAEKLNVEYGYKGIYIVFDEFSKFIEGQDKVAAGFNMKLIQDMCELAADSKESHIFMTLVAHKPIKEYGNYLKKETIDSFTGIEGRIDKEIYFRSSPKNNYELIQNAIVKEYDELNKLPKLAREKYLSEDAVKRGFSLPFYKTEFTLEDFERIIIKGCYPLTPIGTFLLLNISEKVAQNERTLFTFISKPEADSMAEFVLKSQGEVWSVTPELIYDYFSNLFRKETANEDIYDIWDSAEYSVARIQNSSSDRKSLAIRIIKTLALMRIVKKYDELPWNHKYLEIATDLDAEAFEEGMRILIQMDLIYTKESTGEIVFRTKEGSSLAGEIDRRLQKISNTVNINEDLKDIFKLKYVFPKKYNYEFSMTRFFRIEFITAADFLNMRGTENIGNSQYFCDGQIIAIFKEDESDFIDEIKLHISSLASRTSIYVYSDKVFSLREKVLRLRIVKELLNTPSYLSENGQYIKELQILEEDFTAQIEKQLNDMFGDHGDRKIFYSDTSKLHDASQDSLSETVDKVCHALYPDTLAVNNELINKQNVSTGQTASARKRMMESIMKHNTGSFLEGTSQEATMYRALFVRTGLINGDYAPGAERLVELINGYLDYCGDNKIALSELIDVLQNPPYAMRLGVIPVYLSHFISLRNADIVLYYKNMEIPLTEDSIVNACEYPNDYYIFISKTDVEKDKYIRALAEMFFVDIQNTNGESRISIILDGMRRWYRALPQITKNVKGNADYFEEKYIEKALPKLSKMLLLYEVNPYEAILDQLPKALGTDNYAKCIKRLAVIKDRLARYYDFVAYDTIAKVLAIFDVDNSLNHALKDWYERQSKSAKTGIQNQQVSRLMNLIAQINTFDDTEIILGVVKAVTGVDMDMWNANSQNEFLNEIQNIKRLTEQIEDEKEADNCKLTFTTKHGGLVETSYKPVADTEAKLFRNILEGTLEDFESLGTNDLVAILLEEIEKIIEKR